MAASSSIGASSASNNMNSTITHSAEPSTDSEAFHSSDDSTNNTDEAQVAPPVPPRRNFPMMPRPNCTHIAMDYFYTTDILCDHCGSAPRLGWLYVCRQDHYSEAIARRQMESLNKITDKDQTHSRVEELEACGMSGSILDQVKQGNVYDPFQIEVLKNQKVNMLRVMDQQLSREQEPWNVSSKHTVDQCSRDKELPALPDESVSRNVTMRTTVRVAKAAASKIVQKLGHFRRRSQVIPYCGFKCCHACRPYLRDRAYIPLGGAVVGDIIPEKFVSAEPPISKVADVKTLGLRQTYHPRFCTSQDSDEEASNGTSITISTESDASVYEIDPHGLDYPPANVLNWPGGFHSSSDESTSKDQALSRRSPSYSDKLRDRAMPPGLFATSRSSADGGAMERGTGLDNKSDKEEGYASGGMRKSHRSRSSSSKAPSIRQHSIRHSGSHYELGNLKHEAHNQDRPDSGDLTLQSSTRLVEAANGQPARGRPLERTRYYTSALQASSNEHESPRSDASHGSASGDEIQVDGGVALTEEALETHIPDIITDSGLPFQNT